MSQPCLCLTQRRISSNLYHILSILWGKFNWRFGRWHYTCLQVTSCHYTETTFILFLCEDLLTVVEIKLVTFRILGCTLTSVSLKTLCISNITHTTDKVRHNNDIIKQSLSEALKECCYNVIKWPTLPNAYSDLFLAQWPLVPPDKCEDDIWKQNTIVFFLIHLISQS